MHGSTYMPLLDAVEQYLGHSFNVKAVLDKELESLPKMGVKKEAIDSALKEIEEGLEKVDTTCDAMLEQFSLVYPEPPFEKGGPRSKKTQVGNQIFKYLMGIQRL